MCSNCCVEQLSKVWVKEAARQDVTDFYASCCLSFVVVETQKTIGTNSGVGSMKCSAGWKESFKRETEKQSVHAAKLELSVIYIYIFIKHTNPAKLPLKQQMRYFSELLPPERKGGMCVSVISGLSSDYCTFW